MDVHIGRLRDRFSLRTRLTALVTVEMLCCILMAYGLDLLFKEVILLQREIPLAIELVASCHFIGILVTSQLSKLFFNPIKKLREAMDQVAEGDFSVRLEFDKFYQADSSHKQDGNGLGLSLVKRVLAIENGEIQVENRLLGGCCFTVTLRTK